MISFETEDSIHIVKYHCWGQWWQNDLFLLKWMVVWCLFMFVLNVYSYHCFIRKKKKSFCFFFVQDWGAHFKTSETSDRRSDLEILLREVQLRYISCCFIFFIFFSLCHIACIFQTLNYTNNLPHTVCTQDQRANIYTHTYYIQILLFRVPDLGSWQLANISHSASDIWVVKNFISAIFFFLILTSVRRVGGEI
jgi:hypothetical protein